ncbi:MAG: anthranilate synthase component I family protein [Bacteroidia bacterium]|jgi:para-aminobenzoate synthetase component 1|nr:anthranilate synthase component I family protein [Bacteroidia bacterium]
MQLSPKQALWIKRCALLHAKSFTQVMLLDNHFVDNALGLGKLEFLAAFGAKYDYVCTDDNPFEGLQHFINTHPDCWIGLALSYELKNSIENLTSAHPDYIGFPLITAFVPKEVVAINHQLQVIAGEALVERWLNQSSGFEPAQLSPIIPISKVMREQYLQHIEAIKQHIIEGDVYELNYCMEFYAHTEVCPLSLYDLLSQKSPVPFGGFFNWGERSLMCASPERFLCKSNGRIYSQPIKGTAPRLLNIKDDEQQKHNLFNSEKERAENLMIVDLVRNDLARTAITGSIRVDELFGIYSFPQVHQLISTVSSIPDENVHLVDIIKHAFPMGSMTGAPKIMAMKLIEQYENTARGLYSGSIGYINPQGEFDLNVVIRSLQYNTRNHYLSFEVGGAITYDSVAEEEYNECMLKAKAMMQVLQQQ